MYKFFVDLCHPLTLLFLLIAVALLTAWLRFRYMRRQLWLVIIPVVLLALFCTPAVAYVLATWFESAYPPLGQRPDDAQAIVVLSSGVIPPDTLIPQTRLDETALRRCIRAAELYHQGPPCPVLVTGGKVDEARPGEPAAVAMHAFLLQMGVRDEDIMVEDIATDTYQNAVLSARLLQARGVDTILLVTTACHLYRAERCFRSQGLTVIPAGCQYITSEVRYSLGGVWGYVPRAGAARANHALFHEMLGLAWFRLQRKL